TVKKALKIVGRYINISTIHIDNETF
ncbi:hypothetical protein QTP70_000626, partial [Hemibagrus guttatus]